MADLNAFTVPASKLLILLKDRGDIRWQCEKFLRT